MAAPDHASGTTSETTNGIQASLSLAGGRPACEAHVSLRPVEYLATRNQDTTVVRDTVTDSLGQFTFTHLRPGMYRITAFTTDSSQGFSYDTVVVPALFQDSLDTIIALQSATLLKTGSIQGIAPHLDVVDSVLVQLAGTDHRRIVASGAAFRFARVAAGAYQVTYGSPQRDSLEAVRVILEAGETVLLDDDTARFAGSRVVSIAVPQDTLKRSADITRYPLPVILSAEHPSDSALFATTTDPRTLHFLASDGVTFCDFDVELWDTTAAPHHAVIWVSIPIIDGNSPTYSLTILYGGTQVYKNHEPVFSLGKGFGAVWHGSVLGDSLFEVTAGLNGFLNGNVSSGDPATFIGPAVPLAGSGPIVLDSNVNVINGSSTLSVSGWVHPDALPFPVLTIGGATPAGVNGSRDRLFVGLDDEGSLVVRGWPADSLSVDPLPECKSVAAIPSGTWTHITAVISFASDSITLYIDGQLDTAASGFDFASVPVSTTNSAFATIGGGSNGQVARGAIDELRVYRGGRTSSWVMLSYQHQSTAAQPGAPGI